MGIFSSIGSAISSCVSSVCSFIGGIGSAISSVAGGIGARITSFAAALVPGLREIAAVIEVISIICAVVDGISSILGLKKENEDTPEELGIKAEQADKKPEDFDSIEEYIDYLHKEIQIDREKMSELKPEQHAAYMAVGSAIYIKGIEEKYGMDLPADFWQTAASLKFSADETKSFIDSFKSNGLQMKDMCDYLKGNQLSEGKSGSVISDAMINAIKENNPVLSEDDVYKKLQDMALD